LAKKAPDQVIVFRFELQQKERELIESAIGAYNFNQISTPLVAGMSDVSFMVVVGGFLTLMFPEIILPPAEEGMRAVIDAIQQGIYAGQERAKIEREATGDATLDDATGVRDLLGRILYNISHPNWDFSEDWSTNNPFWPP